MDKCDSMLVSRRRAYYRFFERKCSSTTHIYDNDCRRWRDSWAKLGDADHRVWMHVYLQIRLDWYMYDAIIYWSDGLANEDQNISTPLMFHKPFNIISGCCLLLYVTKTAHRQNNSRSYRLYSGKRPTVVFNISELVPLDCVCNFNVLCSVMIDTDHHVLIRNRVLWHTDGHTTGILPPAKGSNQNELNVYTTEWANRFYFDYATWRWEYSGILPKNMFCYTYRRLKRKLSFYCVCSAESLGISLSVWST